MVENGPVIIETISSNFLENSSQRETVLVKSFIYQQFFVRFSSALIALANRIIKNYKS